MRESNFHFPAQNKACVCITSALYDRRAIDSTASLPLISTLTHLSLLTSTHPPIREILCADGGLERLVGILRDVGKKMREMRERVRREQRELRGGGCGASVASGSGSGTGSGSGLSSKGWPGWGGESSVVPGEKKRRKKGKEKERDWDSTTTTSLTTTTTTTTEDEASTPSEGKTTPRCPFKPFATSLRKHLDTRTHPSTTTTTTTTTEATNVVGGAGTVPGGALTREQKHAFWIWSLAFQCVVNIGVRGSEGVRTKVVEAGVVPLVIGVLGGFLHEADRKRHQSEAVEREVRKLRVTSSAAAAAAAAAAAQQQQSQQRWDRLQVPGMAPVPLGRAGGSGGSGTTSVGSSFSSIASNETASSSGSGSGSGSGSWTNVRDRTGRFPTAQPHQQRSVSPAYSNAESVGSSVSAQTGSGGGGGVPTFASIWSASQSQSQSQSQPQRTGGGWSLAQAAAGYEIPRLSTPDAIPSSGSRADVDADGDGETNDGSGGSGSGDGDDDEVMELLDEEADGTASQRKRRGTIKASSSSRSARGRIPVPVPVPVTASALDAQGDLDMAVEVDEVVQDDSSTTAMATRTPRASLARLGSFAPTQTQTQQDAEMRIEDEDGDGDEGSSTVVAPQLTLRRSSNRSRSSQVGEGRGREEQQPGQAAALAQVQQVADAVVSAAPHAATAAASQSVTPPSAASLLCYREEDVLLALQLLAYLSKYPHVRDVFHAPADKATLELTYGTSREAARAVHSFAGKVKAERGEREKAKERHRLQKEGVAAAAASVHSAKEGKKAASGGGHPDACHHFGSLLKCRDRSKSSSFKDNASSAASTLSNVTLATNVSSTSSSSVVQINPLSTNVFSFVERFTVQTNPNDRHTTPFPKPIRYWAGVVMRNACRKDDSRGGLRRCANMQCGKWEDFPREFAKCRRCRKAKYCSKTCQSKAWQLGHRFWCTVKGESDGEEGGEAGEDGAEAGESHHNHRSRSSRSRSARAAAAAAAAAAARPTPTSTDREEDEEEDDEAGSGSGVTARNGGPGGRADDSARDIDPLQALGEMNATFVQAVTANEIPADESDIARQMMESGQDDFGTAVIQDFNRPGLPTLADTGF